MDENKLKILAIDDNPDYLEVLKPAMACAFPGATLFTAVSGQKGIELARKEDPDVILLDITMPGLDGYEVCRRLKADGCLKNIPVVFITAIEIDKASRIKALAAGGEGFLPKPFETEELVAQVRAMAKIKRTNAAQLNEKDGMRMQALQASEAKYRALIETTGTGYLILDSEGRVVDANSEYVRLSGHNELSEILGKSVVEWTAGYEKVKNAEAVAKCVKEGFVRNLVIDYVDSSGKVTPVEISATIEGEGKDARIISVCRDITERRRADEALRFTNALLTTQAEASLDGTLVVDEAGKIVSINKQFSGIWGIPSEVLAARSDELALRAVLDKLVKPEEFLARVNYLYGHKEEKSKEEVALRDGRTLDRYSAPMVGGDGKYYGRVWHFRDVTGRKQAEAELQANKARLSNALEMAHLGHWEYDVASDLFTFNDYFYKIFHTTVEQIGGYTMHSAEYARRFVHPGDMDMVGEETRKAVETADPHFNRQIEHRMLYADGTAGYIAVRFFIVKDSHGRTVKTYGVNQDITERKQAEEAVREAFEMANVLNAMLQHSLANTTLREKLDDHLSVLFALPWLTIQPKGAVLLMNPRGSALVLTVQRGLAPVLLSACANVPLGRCLCGKAAGTGRVVEAVCVGEDHHITYEGMVPHGHYCAPIIAGGKTLGVLNLYLKEGLVLTDSQRRFIKSVTDLLAENIIHAQMEEKFAQSQRMESVGRLAGGVAHDFNNILTAIKCYAEFIRKDLDPQDPKAEDVREILTASDRAVSLTRQLWLSAGAR